MCSNRRIRHKYNFRSKSRMAASLWMETISQIRRYTTLSRKAPLNLILKLIDFVMYIRKLQLKISYTPSSVIACDETAVWFGTISDTTVDAKQVLVKTSGHEKTRITVTLCAKANGT